jgi:hypothetical protein
MILGALALVAAGVAAAASSPIAQDAPMPWPGKEHRWLASLAGEYTAEVSGMLGESEGSYRIESALGGLWIVTQLESTMMGQPYQGTETIGYDPQKGKFVSVWADSMTPKLMTTEGSYDAEAKTLTLSGISTDMNGEQAEMVNTLVFRDDGMTFEMTMEGMPGPMLTIDYTRKAR